MSDLAKARANLLEVLGDLSPKYWTTLSLWYKMKISKDDFDLQIRQLLSEEHINVHNDFLFALLSRCQDMSNSTIGTVKNERSSSLASFTSHANLDLLKKHARPAKVNFDQRFHPYDVLQGSHNMDNVILTDDSDINLCSYEYTLPDVPAMNGRLFLAAWDAGLESVEDVGSNAAKLVIFAVKHHIKDILTACCSRRAGFRLRDKHFKYGINTGLIKPNVWNSTDSYSPHLLHQRNVEYVADAAVTLASSIPPPAHSSISMYELREVLQVHCRVIPSHTVYAANMERILSGLWHPSHDEIEQSRLQKLESKRRQSKLRQQRCLRI